MADHIQEYSGQSYKWPSFKIVFPADDQPEEYSWRYGHPDVRQVSGVRLLKQQSGNLTIYTILPDGPWHGVYVMFDGRVSAVSGKPEIALACRGHWSGGGTYKGWVFGKPGDVVLFDRKGSRYWLVFSADGAEKRDTAPGSVPVEI